MRTCTKCKIEKPRSEFYRDSRHRDASLLDTTPMTSPVSMLRSGPPELPLLKAALTTHRRTVLSSAVL